MNKRIYGGLRNEQRLQIRNSGDIKCSQLLEILQQNLTVENVECIPDLEMGLWMEAAEAEAGESRAHVREQDTWSKIGYRWVGKRKRPGKR